MTQSGSLYENALAERVNGIIKNEFSPKRIYQNHDEAKTLLASNIEVYNNRRPHASLNYLTPSAAHEMTGDFIKQWKHYPYLERTESVNQ